MTNLETNFLKVLKCEAVRFCSRVYDELTIDYLSMWLDSSVDRALHQYRKVMGSRPVQA